MVKRTDADEMKLLTVSEQIPPHKRKGDPAEWVPRAYWSAVIPLETALSAKLGPAAIAVEAYANAGRWVVECPDCSGAQMTSPDDRRFLCTLCANVGVDGLWRPVLWPVEAEAIDAALSSRPLPNRNWAPGETLDDLAVEEILNMGVTR